MPRKNVTNPPQHWKWFKTEAVLVKHPNHPQKILVQGLEIDEAAVKKGIPSGFTLIRMVINLKVVNTANPKLVETVFEPSLEVRIRYTKDDLTKAAGKPFKLGYWDGKRWTPCTFRQEATPKDAYPGWLVVNISQWDDPTLVVGT